MIQEPGEKSISNPRFHQSTLCLLCSCMLFLFASCASSGASSQGSNSNSSTLKPTPTQVVTPTPSVPVISSPQLTYRGHTGPVIGVSWSPDGKRLATCGNDGTVQVFDVSSGHMLWQASVSHYAFAVAWSPDGQKVAGAGSDGTVVILNAANGHQITTFSGQASAIEGLAWSPDSKFVLLVARITASRSGICRQVKLL